MALKVARISAGTGVQPSPHRRAIVADTQGRAFGATITPSLLGLQFHDLQAAFFSASTGNENAFSAELP
jgi:hypothetical protein